MSGKIGFGGGGGSWAELDITSHDLLVAGKDRVQIDHGELGADRVLALVDLTSIAMPDFTDRVRYGMDSLDQVAPGWHEAIDTDTLDLGNTHKCVLGQSWPHYARMHGLLETQHPTRVYTLSGWATRATGSDPFIAMVKHVADGELESADRWAAQNGCQLRDDDVRLINVQAKTLVLRAVNEVHQRGGVIGPDAANIAMSRLARRLLDMSFERLTQTWLAEIMNARARGRWIRRHVVDVMPPATIARYVDETRPAELLGV